MVCNFSGVARAPLYNFEVTLTRKPTLSAEQGARKRIEYVKAENAEEAKRTAARLHHCKAFFASSARKV